ncbi:MAG: hypothetical protein JWL79_3812, partial [Frankiales bacterium]|nr:hypothetical protein [Frankiales bacterium]
MLTPVERAVGVLAIGSLVTGLAGMGIAASSHPRRAEPVAVARVASPLPTPSPTPTVTQPRAVPKPTPRAAPVDRPVGAAPPLTGCPPRPAGG